MEVKKEDLKIVYSQLKSATRRLEAIIADLGCLHNNTTDITTFGPGNIRKILCHDCGEVIEEEIEEMNYATEV